MSADMGIFVASHSKDFPFLKGLLLSIRKFCKGFHRVSIAVPEKDRPELQHLMDDWGLDRWGKVPGERMLVWTQQDAIPDGFMRAQYAMMSMDTYLWDCDYYCLVGSDCLFWDETIPSQYLKNDKPLLKVRSVVEMMAHDSPALCWLPGTEAATGISPDYDFMCHLPLVYTKEMLVKTREAVEKHTGQKLAEYLSEKRGDFSESNVIGAVAMDKLRNSVEWCTDMPVPTNLLQFWSHGGLDFKLDRSEPYANTVGEVHNTLGRTAREVTADVLGDIYRTNNRKEEQHGKDSNEQN